MKNYKTVDSGLLAMKELRECYFNSVLPQELMIEWLVAGGKCYQITDSQDVAGYFITSKENILIEFYLKDAYLTEKEKIFIRMVRNFSIKKAFCKSFDSLLLTCCHTFCKTSRIIGTLFRDYTGQTADWDSELTVRLACEKDIPFLTTFDSGLYETADELQYTVTNKMLYLFEKQNGLIGCGYLIKVLPDRNLYDIGMWVNPDFRRQGYAKKIIAFLKKHCLENAYIPICGCAFDNIASRKTLEYNGFASKHCLIEFELENKYKNSMFTLFELKNYFEENNCDFEIINHDMPIIKTQDAAQYFDIEKAAPTFIINTDRGFIALIVSAKRGKINFKEIKRLFEFSKFDMADKNEIKTVTGYSAGAIPLIGHNLPCIFDEMLLENDYIFGGTGNELNTLKISPNDVVRLNNTIFRIQKSVN